MIPVVAFTRTAAGLFKIYDHGTDWQIIGPGFERWRSVWQHNRAASLRAAAERIPGADPETIIYTLENHANR